MLKGPRRHTEYTERKHLKVILGCYLVDFTKKISIPIPAMQRQCEFGLEALREKRIEGMMFLSNGVMDVGFEAVDWTCEWIQSVGDIPISQTAG